MQAKVGYLVPGTSNAVSEIPSQYQNKTSEVDAYNWFNTNYVTAGTGDFINFTNIPSNASTYSAIWVYIDRELTYWTSNENHGEAFTEAKFDELFDSETMTALSNYVKAGGSLFLCKQAVHLAHRIGRFGGSIGGNVYKPTYSCGGFSDAARTFNLKTKVGTREQNTHALYSGITMDNFSFPLLTTAAGQLSTDNNIEVVEYYTPNNDNTNWHKVAGNGDENLYNTWSTYWKAEVLATYSHIGDYCYIMAMELKPQGDYQGTILTMGAASYQWGDNNGTGLANVKKLTENALTYLESLYVPEKVANPAAATAFLLMANTVDELPSIPEKNAANEFAKKYFTTDAATSQGRYLLLSELSNIPSTVKTIIIHADRAELFDWSSYRENLKTWVKERGGNLVLLRQATILAYDMDRIDYAPHCQPLSNSASGENEPEKNQHDKIRVKMGIDHIEDCGSYSPCYVDRSGDVLFDGMTIQEEGDNKLITLNNGGPARNRCYWQSIRYDGTNDATYSRAQFDAFETRYNCEVLAVEGYVLDFCLASIIRFKKGIVPADSNASWRGIILAIGAGGFQYTDGNQANFGLINTLVESAVESCKPSACDNCFQITIR